MRRLSVEISCILHSISPNITFNVIFQSFISTIKDLNYFSGSTLRYLSLSPSVFLLQFQLIRGQRSGGFMCCSMFLFVYSSLFFLMKIICYCNVRMLFSRVVHLFLSSFLFTSNPKNLGTIWLLLVQILRSDLNW